MIFQTTSITRSGIGFLCRYYVKLVKLLPERFDEVLGLATGLMKATHGTVNDLEVIEIEIMMTIFV